MDGTKQMIIRVQKRSETVKFRRELRSSCIANNPKTKRDAGGLWLSRGRAAAPSHAIDVKGVTRNWKLNIHLSKVMTHQNPHFWKYLEWMSQDDQIFGDDSQRVVNIILKLVGWMSSGEGTSAFIESQWRGSPNNQTLSIIRLNLVRYFLYYFTLR